MEFRGAMDKIVPTQILFCVKEKNQRKINSHRWFFQAFCPLLQPHVCMLFDVGTRPGPTSIYRLWKTFDINADVGGACGEVRAMIGKKVGARSTSFLHNKICMRRYCWSSTVESIGCSAKF